MLKPIEALLLLLQQEGATKMIRGLYLYELTGDEGNGSVFASSIRTGCHYYAFNEKDEGPTETFVITDCTDWREVK